MNIRPNVFLTFDVGDFINGRTLKALHRTLKLLEKYNFDALFFITGHAAEKIVSFNEILELLGKHELGFHSSSHSVHPTIFEYTDVKEYKEAYLTSLKRETSHINPLNGQVEGRGGIELIKRLFPRKKIICYRAPGLCWSPPHLEALSDLGIQFDFSSCLSRSPVYFKGITFFPYPIYIDDPSVRELSKLVYLLLSYRVLRNNVIVLYLHPEHFVNRYLSDYIYFKGNPRQLFTVKGRDKKETDFLFWRFEVFLRAIELCRNRGLLEVIAEPTKSKEEFTFSEKVIQKAYEKSVAWPRTYFNYEPKHLRNHFFEYFQLGTEK